MRRGLNDGVEAAAPLVYCCCPRCVCTRLRTVDYTTSLLQHCRPSSPPTAPFCVLHPSSPPRHRQSSARSSIWAEVAPERRTAMRRRAAGTSSLLYRMPLPRVADCPSRHPSGQADGLDVDGDPMVELHWCGCRERQFLFGGYANRGIQALLPGLWVYPP